MHCFCKSSGNGKTDTNEENSHSRTRDVYVGSFIDFFSDKMKSAFLMASFSLRRLEKKRRNKLIGSLRKMEGFVVIRKQKVN